MPSKTIDILCYAFKISVNGVTCVYSPVLGHEMHLKFLNWLNS